MAATKFTLVLIFALLAVFVPLAAEAQLNVCLPIGNADGTVFLGAANSVTQGTWLFPNTDLNVDPAGKYLFVPIDNVIYRYALLPSGGADPNQAPVVIGTPLKGQACLPNVRQNTYCVPTGFSYDASQDRLWISDRLFARVVRYDAVTTANPGPNNQANYVVGAASYQDPPATSTNARNVPNVVDTAYQTSGDNLYVVDGRRVLRFRGIGSQPNFQAVADAALGVPDLVSETSATPGVNLIAPSGIQMDNNKNRLYIADFARVIRYDDPGALTSGAPQSAVLGQLDFGAQTQASTQTNLGGYLEGLYTDNFDNLLITDSVNNRVVLLKDASTVASGTASWLNIIGQQGWTQNLPNQNANNPISSGLRTPVQIRYAPGTGFTYVLDLGNNRVVGYPCIAPSKSITNAPTQSVSWTTSQSVTNTITNTVTNSPTVTNTQTNSQTVTVTHTGTATNSVTPRTTTGRGRRTTTGTGRRTTGSTGRKFAFKN